MTTKPTAVVVRLPLSADQEETLFEISERDCLNSAIAAIGTPVAGGELEAVGFEVVHVHGSDLTYCRDRAQKIASGAEGIIYPLIRQSDAQAALAAAQAEIGQLWEALVKSHAALKRVTEERFTSYRAKNGREVSVEGYDGERCDIIHSDVTTDCEAAIKDAETALKGPAA